MLSDVVGERITTWRKRRGWNRERLAEECSKAGMKMSASIITDIESGRVNKQTGIRRRTVSVDELAVFAFALNIAPPMLMTSYPDDLVSEIFPGTLTYSYLALSWIAGDQPSPVALSDMPTGHEVDIEAYTKDSYPMMMLAYHDNMVLVRTGLASDLAEAVQGDSQGDPVVSEKRYSILAQIEDADENLVDLRDDFRKLGYPEPRLPEALSYLEGKSAKDYQIKLTARAIAKHRADYEKYMSLVLGSDKEIQ